MRAAVLVSLLAAQTAFTQPVIYQHGIVNNASYTKYGLRNYGIAQGSIFAIFGEKLGPDTLVQVTEFPLRKELGRTSVQVTSGGVTVDALPLYVSAGQVGALLPSNTPVGTATVTVKYGEQTSAAVETTVVKRSLALFAANQGGSGPAVATNFITEANQPRNTVLTPARPAQVVTLWATGLGPVAGDEAAGPLPGDMDIPVTVQIASVPARVLYRGRSGCCSGLDQIAIEIPQNVEGCHLPVFVQSGATPSTEMASIPQEGVATEQTTIAVTRDGSPCSDPAGLNAQELTDMQARGYIRLGWLWLENSAAGVQGTAVFGKFSSAAIFGRLGVFGTPSPVSASLFTPVDVAAVNWSGVEPLDAGSLTLTGSGGTIQFTKTAAGMYSLSAAALAPGTYTLNGSGGADVRAFTATVVVPQRLTWLNPSDIRKAGSYEPEWRPDPNGFVMARHEISNAIVTVTARLASAASAGKQVLPGGLLDPPRGNVMSVLFGGAFGGLRLKFSLIHFTPVRFTAEGLDVGLIGAADSQSSTYAWN